MPLHSAVASARLRSCIAAGSACWSCLSQGEPLNPLASFFSVFLQLDGRKSSLVSGISVAGSVIPDAEVFLHSFFSREN
jgi:hypothetical protein